jgi:Ca2+-transporting ATPase
MIDPPPREEAKAGVETCSWQGIKPVMITGDHRLTAEAIARRIGILQPAAAPCPAPNLDNMTDEELQKQVGSVSVYSRVRLYTRCAWSRPCRPADKWWR